MQTLKFGPKPAAIFLLSLLLLSVMESRGFTISGRVLDTKSKPVAGAKVFPTSDSSRFARTDSLGRFSLTVPSALGLNRAREYGNRQPDQGIDFRLSRVEGLAAGVSVGPSGPARFDLRGRAAEAVPSETEYPATFLAKSSQAVRLSVTRRYYRDAQVTATEGATDVRIVIEKLPNVLLLLSDDQGWTDYGFMGHATIKTPKLDGLASQGMVFTRGYTTTSLCRPALMSLVTGLYAHQHGVTGNDPPEGVSRDSMLTFIDKANTLQRMLHREKGYVTLQTGKWWEGDWKRGHFTSGMTLNPQPGGRHGDAGLDIGRKGLAPIQTFLDTTGERPFFIWYAPMLPHQPHNPPQRLLDKYLTLTPSIHLARYWAMVEWWDETCGQVLAMLEAKGERDNTLVFYTSDNGWAQNPDSASFLPISKNSPYDLGSRTPILVSWPAKLKPLRNTQALVSNIDFMPTVLSAVGIPRPGNLPGVSLLDSGRVAGERGQVFGENFLHDMGALHDPKVGLRYRWTVQGRWKLILDYPDNQVVGLFDILADPMESSNLAAGNAATISRLRAGMNSWYSP